MGANHSPERTRYKAARRIALSLGGTQTTNLVKVKPQAYADIEARYACAHQHREPSNLCEFCEQASAVYVHHLTYVRLGNELLTDLLVVCGGCHAILHA